MEQIPFSTMAWRAGRVLPRLVYRYDPNAMSEAVKLMARNVPLPDELEDARQIRVLDALIRRLEMDTGRKITGVFCNQYRDGKDYTPAHQDSYGCDVFTLSLGATRKCVFDPIPVRSEFDCTRESERQEFELNSGDLLYFNMAANNVYKHSIPACSKAGPRISLVFFAQ
jgi:alkylated DNA repair dioxygenase AlkB